LTLVYFGSELLFFGSNLLLLYLDQHLILLLITDLFQYLNEIYLYCSQCRPCSDVINSNTWSGSQLSYKVVLPTFIISVVGSKLKLFIHFKQLDNWKYCLFSAFYYVQRIKFSTQRTRVVSIPLERLYKCEFLFLT